MGNKLASKKQEASCFQVLLVIGAMVCFLVFLFRIAENHDYRSRGLDPDKARALQRNNEALEREQKAREEKLQDGFSMWDGAHRGMTKLIKASMNDPRSYEHVETTYIDKGDHLIVKSVFRGKNAFGGVVQNWITAKTDLTGNVIEVIAQGP